MYIYTIYFLLIGVKMYIVREQLENTKGITRRRKSKDRQYNGQQKKKTKGQAMVYKHTEKLRLSIMNPTKHRKGS